MARGTANTGAGKVAGNTFKAETANDLLEIAIFADDDALCEMLGFEPPAGVTATTPRVAFVALRGGPVFTGDAAARNVNVAPMRGFRSSISNAAPREMLSALSLATTTVAMPAVVGGGLWRLELLYAQVAYVDSAFPEKGTTLTFAFAPTAAGAAVAGAPTVATLPANTSTTWNIPLAYVKNVGGAVAIANEDILPVPWAADGGGAIIPVQRYIGAQKSGIDARRSRAVSLNHPVDLVSGGSSALAAFADTRITSTNTPISLARAGVEFAIREILIPKDITGGTGGVETATIIDDTRDWRGANFYSLWLFPNSVAASNYFAEDDAGLGVAASTVFPYFTVNAGVGTYAATHFAHGQSWRAFTTALHPAGTDFTAAEVATGTSINGGANYLGLGAGDYAGLTVDPTTGVMKWRRIIAGAGAGGPITILLVAVFGNHRPL